MNKIKLALSSRTTWTLVVLFVINGFSAIQSSIPTQWIEIINPLLGLLAIYFKVNPSQKY